MARQQGKPTHFGGIRYRSRFESEVAADLARRMVDFEYEGERVYYCIPATYITDFTIPEEESITGKPIYVEVKGWLKPQDKRKMLAVRAENPGMDIRFLLQKGYLKRSTGLTKEARWCNAQGFAWAEGTVPDSWLKPRESEKDEF
jgi:hypothetical protein